MAEYGDEQKEEFYYDDNEDDDDDDSQAKTPNLYSLLNLTRTATPDEIHRSYRTLSTTFHPDKARRRRRRRHQQSENEDDEEDEDDPEEIQETFLLFKYAHDVLIDPVLRLAYDGYGETGVELLRRVQQQQRDQTTRKDQAAAKRKETNEDDDDDENENEGEEDSDDDDDADSDDLNLYECLEDLLVQNNKARARDKLRHFMEQHDYLQNLAEENFVHLHLSMTFPPPIPLTPVLYRGRDYLRAVQKNLLAVKPADASEQEYYQQRNLQERRLVDYQISQLRSSQKADVGFTLSNVQPPQNSHNARNKKKNSKHPPLRPSKWSMAIGSSTDVVYPTVKELEAMMAKADPKAAPKETKGNPTTLFVNTSYQAAPTTQVFGTVNIQSENDSHQYSLGSTHTFSNQTACRYSLTYLSKTPLPDNAPLLASLKTYRHLQGFGTTSIGVSAASNGQLLEWNAKWEASKSPNPAGLSHKYSAKASMGMLQGNSLEFGYKCKFPKKHESPPETNETFNVWYWLEEYIHLPKRAEATAVWGSFSKLNATVTHEITSLATHPLLGFGLEHDITLGRWNWVWEIEYNQSSFRIPIPVLQLGTITNTRAFYSQKFYYGLYCLLLQSIVTDLLEDDEHRNHNNATTASSEYGEDDLNTKQPRKQKRLDAFPVIKSKMEAERQLALMAPVAETNYYREQQTPKQSGLLVLRATYWHKLTHTGGHEDDSLQQHEVVSMDATTQLRFWVHNGKLVCPKTIPKSSWMGFYTLATESRLLHKRNIQHTQRPKERIVSAWNRLWKTTMKPTVDYLVGSSTTTTTTTSDESSTYQSETANQEPQLTVRYSYKGRVYEITVGETDGLTLPCSENDDVRVEFLGNADSVQ